MFGISLISKTPIQVWIQQQRAINSIRKLHIKLKYNQKNTTQNESQVVLRGITKIYLKSVIQFFKRVQLRQEYKVLIERQFNHLFKELEFIKERHNEFNKEEAPLIQEIETQINKFYELYKKSNRHWLLKY